MSLRTRIFIIVSLGVLAILGVSLLILLFSRSHSAAPSPSGPTTTTPSNVIDNSNFNQTVLPGATITPPPSGVPVKAQTSLETEQTTVKQLAKLFIERYNSYSTQNNSQNILSVQNLVTPAYWQKLSGYIGQSEPSSFTGVTTVVLSTSIDSWQDTSAALTLKTQRVINNNGVTTVTYQTYTVSMVKQNSSWLVSNYASVKS